MPEIKGFEKVARQLGNILQIFFVAKCLVVLGYLSDLFKGKLTSF